MATPAELRRLYEIERWTLAEVATSAGVARQLLEDAGTPDPGLARPPELDDQVWLSASYARRKPRADRLTTGVQPQTVARTLERHGMNRRRSGPR